MSFDFYLPTHSVLAALAELSQQALPGKIACRRTSGQSMKKFGFERGRTAGQG